MVGIDSKKSTSGGTLRLQILGAQPIQIWTLLGQEFPYSARIRPPWAYSVVRLATIPNSPLTARLDLLATPQAIV